MNADGSNPTPTTKENVMQEKHENITIHGDGTINTGRGTAEVIWDDERITVTLPDRFGMPGPMIDFTHEDAVRFAKAVLAASRPAKPSAPRPTGRTGKMAQARDEWDRLTESQEFAPGDEGGKTA